MDEFNNLLPPLYKLYKTAANLLNVILLALIELESIV